MRFQSRMEALRFLGLESGATEEQIKMVYHTLVKQYHPDENPEGEVTSHFYEIRDAYEYLMAAKDLGGAYIYHFPCTEDFWFEEGSGAGECLSEASRRECKEGEAPAAGA